MISASALKHAFRVFQRDPAFAWTAVVVLGIAIAGTTAIFSLVHGILLRPLPFEDADRLVFLWNRSDETGQKPLRPFLGDILDFREHGRSFEGIEGMSNVADASLAVGGEARHVRLARATPGIFDLLGVQPALGRFFRTDDVVPTPELDAEVDSTAAGTIVISHALWVSAFGRDRGALGRTVRVNGTPVVIIGVLPPRFELPIPPEAGMSAGADVWSPIDLREARAERDRLFRDQDSDLTGAVIARLAGRRTLSRAQSEMDAVAELQRELYDYHRHAGMRIEVRALQSHAFAHVRPLLLALLGAVVLLFLIACINVTNLLLARGIGRAKEMAVRSALGASRRRIAGQLLLESAVLGISGAVLGLVLARWGVGLLVTHSGIDLPRTEAIGIDVATFGFAVLLAITATLLSGSAPALAAAAGGPRDALAGRSTGPAPSVLNRLRDALVVGQLALTLSLLVGSGLLFRSALNLRRIEPGFEPRGVLVFDLSLRDRESYRGPADRARFVRELESGLVGLPGVEAVGLVNDVPLSGEVWTIPFGREGEPQGEWSRYRAALRMITPDYFRAIGTRLMEGRPFTQMENRSEDRRVIIIDESLAHRMWPGGGAVGRRLSFPLDGRPVTAEIVGVAERARYEDLRAPGIETIYVPYRHEASRDVSIAVRAGGSSSGLPPLIRHEVHELDPALATFNMRTLGDHVSRAIAPVRFTFRITVVFALVAATLAGVGLYGVIALGVKRRRREIGIRIALGAPARSVRRQVIGRGLSLVIPGLLIGVGLATFSSRAIDSLLFGVPPIDPLTLGGVSLALLGLGGIACYLPARRATRIDPIIVLAEE